jgi:hypothetical protein
VLEVGWDGYGKGTNKLKDGSKGMGMGTEIIVTLRCDDFRNKVAEMSEEVI